MLLEWSEQELLQLKDGLASWSWTFSVLALEVELVPLQKRQWLQQAPTRRI
jgi:hypothetical protein